MDAPFLFEGFVVSELVKSGIESDRLKFWRTKNRQEVDIVLDQGISLVPVEIKYKSQLKHSDLQGLFSFRNNYSQSQGLFMIAPYSNSSQNDVQILSPFELNRLSDLS
jgi:predicted AAA+ superfamily ATPase